MLLVVQKCSRECVAKLVTAFGRLPIVLLLLYVLNEPQPAAATAVWATFVCDRDVAAMSGRGGGCGGGGPSVDAPPPPVPAW